LILCLSEVVYRDRQQRVLVLEALEQAAKQFGTRDGLYPIRVPRDPLPLDELVERALGPDGRRFDVLSLRARTLLSLEWPDGSRWDAWVIALPSNLRLFCDIGDEEPRVLASGGRNAGDETDRQFLMLLAESAGEAFGIEMSGGPPSRVRSSLNDRAFLLEVFVALFEVTGMEDAVREAAGPAESRDEEASGHDFKRDVERWLALVHR
jgi:hypothetical protein